MECIILLWIHNNNSSSDSYYSRSSDIHYIRVNAIMLYIELLRL